MSIVERASTFDYGHGKATIQLVRANKPNEVDAVIRLWNGEPQSYWNVSTGSAYVGFCERAYAADIMEEARCLSQSVK